MRKTLAVCMTVVALSSVTGCMGRNAMTKSVHDWNLETADSAWGREGLFLLTIPVWYITNFLDLFIINSIEFWSGENPISNEGALVDMKVASLEKMGIKNVASAQSRYLENEVLMYVSYKDGTQEVFHATRQDGIYSFYRGKDLVIQVEESQMKDLQAAIQRRMDTYAKATGTTRTL